MTLNATWGNLLLGMCFFVLFPSGALETVWICWRLAHWDVTLATDSGQNIFFPSSSLTRNEASARKKDQPPPPLLGGPTRRPPPQPARRREGDRDRGRPVSQCRLKWLTKRKFMKRLFIYFFYGVSSFFFLFYGRMIYVHAILLSFFGAFHVWFNLTLWPMSHRWA